MTMRIHLAAAILTLFGALPASACSCITRTEAEQISRNNVIVQGHVVSVKSSTRLGRKTEVARIRVQSSDGSVDRRYINVEAYEILGQCAVTFKVNEAIRFAALKRGLLYRTNICKIFPLKA